MIVNYLFIFFGWFFFMKKVKVVSFLKDELSNKLFKQLKIKKNGIGIFSRSVALIL